jgi:hypothetical protein
LAQRLLTLEVSSVKDFQNVQNLIDSWSQCLTSFSLSGVLFMFKSIGVVCGGIAFGVPVVGVAAGAVGLVAVGAGIGYLAGSSAGAAGGAAVAALL